jgi:ribonucleoside-diphosphate reductase beta chain
MKGVGQIVSFSVRDENLHSEGGIYLFNTFCEEFPGLKEQVKNDVRNAAIITYQLEEQFLNNLFSEGNIRTLNKEDLLEFVKHRINLKLNHLGYEQLFETDKDALERMSWFSSLTSGREFGDFFATRVSEYSQKKITANDMF